MNYVEPIRDVKKIENIKIYLKKSSYRDYVLFELGINCGLRISDLLKLKVKDIRGIYHLRLRETKTGKPKVQLIPKNVYDILQEYTLGMDDEEYIFQSRKGKNQPIQRQRAFTIIQAAAAREGLQNIGTHTMRKTFGYHFYQRTKDLALLMEIFNHSKSEVTRRYIGINQDVMDEAMSNFYL